MKRPGLPAELATAYVTLAHPLSSYTSGTTIAVTGSAKLAEDPTAEAASHQAVDVAKRKLGERGPVWWTNGAPDLNPAITQTDVFHPDRDPAARCACCLRPVGASAGPGSVW